MKKEFRGRYISGAREQRDGRADKEKKLFQKQSAGVKNTYV